MKSGLVQGARAFAFGTHVGWGLQRNPSRYNYRPEPFGVRLKPFVPLRELGTPRWTALLRGYYNGFPLRPETAQDPLKQLVHGA